MADNFIAGHPVPFSWAPLNGETSLLNIKEHSLDISVMLHDVTGNRAGGVRARLAGPLDIQGRIVASMDLDAVPFQAPPLLIPGCRGIAVWGVSTTRGIQTPLILEKYHQGTGTDKELAWDCDWKADSRSGLVVYPSF